MFGIDDPGIYLGYLFAILGTLACVIYGIINWNKGVENDSAEIQQDLDWEESDDKMKSEF